MSAAGMALCSYLLLLLVAHSVPAVQGDRHYVYHIHSVHFNPSQNSSARYLERSAAILFDGKPIVYYTDGKNWASAQLEKRKTSMKPKDLREFEGFNYLLEASSHGAHHFEKRRGCEIERGGAEVSLLKTTAEYRHNGKLILHFNVDTSQWEAEDKKFLSIKNKWDHLPRLNQNTKDYLLQKCGERLLKYLDAKDRDEMSESEILRFFINEDIEEPWTVQERNWTLLLFMCLSIFLLTVCTLYRRRNFPRCVFCPWFNLAHIAGVLHQFLSAMRKQTADDDDEDDEEEDDLSLHTGLILA